MNTLNNWIKKAFWILPICLIGQSAIGSNSFKNSSMRHYAGNCNVKCTTQDKDTSYLSEVIEELQKKWPKNKNINLVFHGHSVPSGYLRTPQVNTFDSYPYVLLKKLTEKYPTAVINVIKTCTGGENAEQGAKRFKSDVLVHKPDVIFIDYALNDRYIGLERAKKSWEKMIRIALKHKIKVVLLTPTPDITENILDPNAPLAQHTKQIIALGEQYHIPVVDSYNYFRKLKKQGADLSKYMAQSNHINQSGHLIVGSLLATLFGIE